MTSLFDDYAVIAESGLFDADYYMAANPDVAELGCDPLLHYLEYGARQMRNPNPAFDAKDYLAKCGARLEDCGNPLLHYIGATTGVKDMAAAQPGAAAATDLACRAGIDTATVEMLPDGKTTRITGQGWAIAFQTITKVAVSVGGVSTIAYYGLERRDVRETFPQYPNAGEAGIAFTIDGLSQSDTEGLVDIEMAITTAGGQIHRMSSLVYLLPAEDTGAIDEAAAVKLEIDSCAIDSDGILIVSGWCACLATIASVRILIDDQPAGAADYGQPRPDVAEIFPEYPGAERSGFEFKSDATAFGGGRKSVKVVAVGANGVIREEAMPLEFVARRKRAAPVKDRTINIFCDLTELTTDGRLVIEGWAVCPGNTDSINIELDGALIGQAETGRERPDVGNLYPLLPHARQAGFSFDGMIGKAVKSGDHMVVLRVKGGGVEAEIPLTVVAQAATRRSIHDRAAESATSDLLKLNIDLPRIVGDVMDSPIHGNLEIAGWAVARHGIESIDITLDGEFFASAFTGIRRLDVFAQFGDWPNALTSGFTALLPHRAMPIGNHRLGVVLKDKLGNTKRSEFETQVEKAPETAGPWALTRKSSLAGDEINGRVLASLDWRPNFRIVLAVNPKDKEELRLARLALATVDSQIYRDYRVSIVTKGKRADTGALSTALLSGLTQAGQRVDFVQMPDSPGAEQPWSRDAYLMVLKPGDQLGCNALMEFALDGGFHRDADFLYADDRRINPATGLLEAFFKPNWSPDLLLSTNYIGRAWCATAALVEKCGLTLAELVKNSSYDLALRLTESAAAIRHVPYVLVEAAGGDGAAGTEKRAVAAALKRRGIGGAVQDGAAPGLFRVKRDIAATGLVSIIIPTCGARGLIKTCLETLRSLTRYKNFEIVCIENIPADQPELKDWLRANADTVIETAEPFNWSRFNNLAVAQSHGDYLLFLNDDIEILTPDWLDVMLEHAQRPEVGVVGPQLLYPDRRVQHAGMFLASNGIARHAFRYLAENDLGYFGLARTQRNVIAVTGACLLTRRETFEALGRFDEIHTIVNNDLDYCLRVWRAGLSTVYTPHTSLIHHEQASRVEMGDIYNAEAFDTQWAGLFITGDPFYHISLSKDRDDYSFEWEPVELINAGRPVYDRETIKKILVVKLDHIGDCITALPAIRRLRKHFPAARLTILSSRASKSVWALEPAIDEIIEFDFFHAKSSLGEIELTDDDWRALEEKLAPYRFDLAIDLRKHMETRPVLRHTGARYVAGYDHKGLYPWLDIALEWNEDQPSFRKRQHTGDDLINLIDAIVAAGDDDRATIAPLAGALPKGLFEDSMFTKPVVCVHPTAGNDLKQWPPEYFTSLIDRLVTLDDVHIALVGAPEDEDIVNEIIAGVTNKASVWSFVGKLKLAELPGFIALCALFVGNDSGPKHIAAGLGVPTIGIHSGTVDSREWGPMGVLAVGIGRDMTCSPCYRSKVEDCHRGLACLRQILPGDVYRACRKLLALSAGQMIQPPSEAITSNLTY